MRVKNAKHTAFRISDKFALEELALLSSRATISRANSDLLSSEQIMSYNRLNPIIGYRKSAQSIVSVVYGFQQFELLASLSTKTTISVPYVDIVEPSSIRYFVEMELLRIALSQVSSQSYGALLNSYLSYISNYVGSDNRSFYKKISFAAFSGIDRRQLSPSVGKTIFSYKT